MAHKKSVRRKSPVAKRGGAGLTEIAMSPVGKKRKKKAAAATRPRSSVRGVVSLMS